MTFIPAGTMCTPAGTICMPAGTIGNKICTHGATRDTYLRFFLHKGVNYLPAEIIFSGTKILTRGSNFYSAGTKFYWFKSLFGLALIAKCLATNNLTTVIEVRQIDVVLSKALLYHSLWL